MVCILTAVAKGLPRLGSWMHCTAAKILILLFRPLSGPRSSLPPTGSLARYQAHPGPVSTPKWAQEIILGTKLNFNYITAPASFNPTLISTKVCYPVSWQTRREGPEKRKCHGEGTHHPQSLWLSDCKMFCGAFPLNSQVKESRILLEKILEMNIVYGEGNTISLCICTRG